MAKALTKKARSLFEAIRHIDESGEEYWTARELAKVLEYTDFRNFIEVARKAWTACSNSGKNPYDHFVKFNEMVGIGSNAEREVLNIKLTRYASYLTVMNASSGKPLVAQAQTYFGDDIADKTE